MISINKLILHDNKWIQFGDYTKEEENIFTIDQRVEARPAEYSGEREFVHLSLSYEHHVDLKVTERESGTYFDWISSAGGLNKGLRLILTLVVSFFDYNVYSAYMVTHLFKLGS